MRSRSLWFLAFAFLALPFALNARPLQVAGRVLAEGTRGLSGARVELFPAYEGYAEAVRRIEAGSGPVPLATALTGADGSFRIGAPGPSCFRLVVRADGYIPLEYPLAPLVEDLQVPEASMEEANPVEARLIGMDGQPVSGVAARLESTEYPDLAPGVEDLPRWRPADWSGTSGPDGKLSFPWQLGEQLRLSLVSPRFLGQGLTLTTPEMRAVLRLASSPEARIEVRDAAGHPIAGALIRWKGWPVAVTGPGGRVDVAVPEGDPLTVESAAGDQTKVVPGPGNAVQPVRLEPPRRIAGKILDEKGRPVQGGLVWIGWPSTTPPAFSGADGGFRLDLPPGGEGWVQSAAAGFLPGSRRLVRKGEQGPLRLELSPAATVSGMVVDSAGRGVAEVRLTLEGSRNPHDSVSTSPDGRFRLRGLRPASAYKLTATHEGFAPTAATVRTAATGQAASPVRIVLDDGATAFGQIAAGDGQPVAGAELALVKTEDPFGREIYRTRSDREGKFQLRHLLPGTFDLVAMHPDHARLQMKGIEIAPGTPPVDLGRLTLPEGTVIEGQVVDGQGAPVAGAEILATPGRKAGSMAFLVFREMERGGRSRVQTGRDGRFQIKGLDGGSRYDLMAAHPSYGMTIVSAVPAPTEEPVRIELKKLRLLSGQVVGPGGEPVAGATLSWIQRRNSGDDSIGSAFSSAITTDADGRFEIPDIFQSQGDLVATAEGYLNGRLPRAQIPADRDATDLKIVLERGSRLDVRVLNAEGDPLPGILVSAYRQDARGEPSWTFSSGDFAERPTVTDAEGRSRMIVGTGGYLVSAMVEGRTLSERVTVGPGQASVELRMSPGVEVSGRVVGEDGAGVAGAMLQMKGSANVAFNFQTGPDGSFVFASVPDGSYQLTAFRLTSGTPARSTTSLEVVVAGRPVQGLEVRFSGEP